MNNYIKNGVIAGLAVVVLGFGLLLFKPAAQQLGALAGPDIPSNYLQWGGVYQYNANISTVATSSVFCSIQNPAGATSTIVSANAIILTNAIAQATTVSIATSTGQNLATTTASHLVLDATVAASVGDVIPWLPTSTSTYTTGRLLQGLNGATATGESPFILAPNEWVQFRIATGTAGTFTGGYFTGNCNLRVQKI